MELVDRDIPLQELNTAWHHAAIQEGCAVLIYGEAGIGKTALVEQFIHQQKKPIRLLWGACDALFTPRPLGPLHDIAAQTQGSLSQLLQAEATPSMIFAACLHELQSQPTIVVVEDIHWADEATLDLLKYLGRRIHLTHSLLIVTYRDDALNPQHPLRLLLGDLATSAGAGRDARRPRCRCRSRRGSSDRRGPDGRREAVGSGDDRDHRAVRVGARGFRQPEKS